MTRRFSLRPTTEAQQIVGLEKGFPCMPFYSTIGYSPPTQPNRGLRLTLVAN